MVSVSSGAGALTREHYQTSFTPLLYGVGIAIVLTIFLRETGPAVRAAAPALPPPSLQTRTS